MPPGPLVGVHEHDGVRLGDVAEAEAPLGQQRAVPVQECASEGV